MHQLSEDAPRVLRRGGYEDDIGDVIAEIFEKLDRGICARCTKRIFNECKSVPRETPRELESPGAP